MIKSGIECETQIIGQICLKSYRSQWARDIAYSRQETCSLFGVGPKVYRKIGNLSYESEIAKVLSDIYKIDFPEQLPFKVKNKIMKEIKKVCSSFQDIIGEEYFDDHCGNFGYVRGNLVIIDFGTKT